MSRLIIILLLLSGPAFASMDFMIAVTRQDASMEWWYAVPHPFTPRVSSVNSVPHGEYFNIIPILKEYASDSNRTVHVTYDIEVVYTNGTVDTSATNCIAHHGTVDETVLLPAQGVIHMCFDPDDPPGEYTVNITAYDRIDSSTNRQSSKIFLEPFKAESLTAGEREKLFTQYAETPNPSTAFASFLQTEQSFFTDEGEPIWSAIWFFKTIFENNEYLIPHLLEHFPKATQKQQKDTILLLSLLNKANKLDKIPAELRTYKRKLESGRIPDPYSVITDGRQVDMLWAEYFATGRIKPVRQLLQALELVEYVGTLEKIKNGELEIKDPDVIRKGKLEATFQSTLWSLRSYLTESPLVLEYCYSILESEELAKPAQSCLVLLVRSVNENRKKETAP